MAGTLPRFAFAALIGLLPHGLAAQITPAGPAVRADVPEVVEPYCPRLAVGADRSFEIVWDYDGIGDYSVHGRHFSASGEPTDAAPVQIGGSGDFDDYNMVGSVAALPDGFQVFFTNFDAIFERPPLDQLQRLNLSGAPVGATEDLKNGVSFLFGPAGKLYEAFYLSGPKNLAIQPVLPDGTAQGRRIVLNTRPIGLSFIELAPLSGGDFVTVWDGPDTERRPRQVIRGRVVRNGVPVGQDFDVNAVPLGLRGAPPSVAGILTVGAPSSGSFAVVWAVQDAASILDSNVSIHLRFFDSSGRPRTPEVVAVPGAKGVSLQSAAFDTAGNLLLLWGPPASGVLRARLFSGATGAPLGPAYQLGSLGDFVCGQVGWAGSSWIVAYRSKSDPASLATILWQRFTE